MWLFKLALIPGLMAAAVENPNSDGRENVKEIGEIFAKGAAEYRMPSHRAAGKYCTGQTDWRKIFCLDGYFLSLNLDALSAQKSDLAKALSDHLKKSTPSDAQERASFLRAMGMAFAQLNLDPTAYNGSLQALSSTEGQYFIDGWGSAQYHKFGYEASLKNCQGAPGEPMKSACQWGMGRGFFFSGIPAGSRADFDPNFVAGYLFSRALTTDRVLDFKEVEKFKAIGLKAGELFKRYFVAGAELKQKKPKLEECFTTKHALECAKFL